MTTSSSKIKALSPSDPLALKSMLTFDRTIFVSKIPSIKDLMFSLRIDDGSATHIHQALLLLAPLIMDPDTLKFHSMIEARKTSHSVSIEVHGADLYFETEKSSIKSLALMHFLCHHPAARDFQPLIPDDLRRRVTNTDISTMSLEDESNLSSIFSHGLKCMLNNTYGSYCLTLAAFCLALSFGYFDAEIFLRCSSLRFISQLHTINITDNRLNAGALYASLVRSVVTIINESLSNLGPFENPYSRSVYLSPSEFSDELTPANSFSCMVANSLLNEDFDKGKLQLAITEFCAPDSIYEMRVSHATKDYTKTLERTCSRCFNDLFKTSLDWPMTRLSPESYLPRVTCSLFLDNLEIVGHTTLILTENIDDYRNAMKIDSFWSTVSRAATSKFSNRRASIGISVDTPADLPIFTDSPVSNRIPLSALPEPITQVDCLSIPVYQSFTPEYKISSVSPKSKSPQVGSCTPSYMSPTEFDISASSVYSFNDVSTHTLKRSRGKLRSLISNRTSSMNIL